MKVQKHKNVIDLERMYQTVLQNRNRVRKLERALIYSNLRIWIRILKYAYKQRKENKTNY